MGKVKRMLSSKKIKHLQEKENFCGIELCETVHFHMAGFRFELTAQQFEGFAETVAKALQIWVSLGKPATADFKVLAGEYLPDEPVYPDRFDIEEQTIPQIHIHLRGLSFRLNTPEFMEFADAIEEAKQNFKS